MSVWTVETTMKFCSSAVLELCGFVAGVILSHVGFLSVNSYAHLAKIFFPQHF